MYLAFTAFLMATASMFLSAEGAAADISTPLTRGEWGYLRRGPRRAFQAAVFTLVERGALRFTSRGAVTRDGRLPADAPALERAIYNRAHTPVGMSALWQAPKVRQALRDMRASLVARGLVLPAWRRNMGRGLVLLALLTAVADLVAHSGRSAVEVVLVSVVSVALLVLVPWLWRREHVTRAAARLVRNMRTEYPKPKRRSRDGLGSNTARDVGINVALYGLWTATAMGVEHGAMRGVLSESFFGDGGHGDGGGDSGGGY